MTSVILGNKEEVISKLTNQISLCTDLKNNEHKFDSWIGTTMKIIDREFSDNKLSNDLNLKLFFEERNKVVIAVNFLENLIVDIKNGLHDPIIVGTTEISEENVLLVIRNILNNFPLHILEMYQKDVHGNGTLKKEDLDLIRIGNEYDVQRILYSLIRPIFPKARIEVSIDDDYGTTRYDIYLNEYSVVIEVKCTRPSLTEKKLREEIASDIYHYKHNFVFFFIYDKEQKIKNKEVFIEAYTNKISDQKIIETVVVQPIVL